MRFYLVILQKLIRRGRKFKISRKQRRDFSPADGYMHFAYVYAMGFQKILRRFGDAGEI